MVHRRALPSENMVAPRVVTPTQRLHPWRVHGALLAVQLLFGSWPVVGKVALKAIPGPMLIGLRATLATVLFFALGHAVRLTGRQHAGVAVAAVLGITINQLLFIGGLTRTSAVNATVLATTIPVWTLFLSLLTRTEAPTAQRILGITVAFGGALWVTGAGALSMGDTFLWGNLMLLVSTLAYAGYLVVARRLSAALPPLSMVPWIFFYGAVFTLPFAGPVAWETHVDWTPALVLLVGYIVLGPTVGTYLLNAVALREAPPTLVAVYIYLQPLVAAVLAYPVLGETPSPGVLTGGAIIFLGVFLTTRQAPRS